jgi:hypothetical protein
MNSLGNGNPNDGPAPKPRSVKVTSQASRQKSSRFTQAIDLDISSEERKLTTHTLETTAPYGFAGSLDLDDLRETDKVTQYVEHTGTATDSLQEQELASIVQAMDYTRLQDHDHTQDTERITYKCYVSADGGQTRTSYAAIEATSDQILKEGDNSEEKLIISLDFGTTYSG